MSGILRVKVVVEKAIDDINSNSVVQKDSSCNISAECQLLNFHVGDALFHSLLRTPLMLSVLNGHTDCVYSLLNKGANVDAKDKWGRTALHRGVREYFFYVLSCFIHMNLKYGLNT